VRDAAPKEEDFARNNYGVACFFLSDFLKNNVRNLKLLAPVVPVKRYQDLESQNLDLNTTAKKNLRALIESSTYFQSDTQLVVSFTLAFPVGSYAKKLEIERAKTPEVIVPKVEAATAVKKPTAADAAAKKVI
jgi:hypothetical protein